MIWYEYELLKILLLFVWFVRDVNVMFFLIFKNWMFVNWGFLIWNVFVGLLLMGLKLIEFEVFYLNLIVVRWDLIFIKVEELCLIVVINGGFEILVFVRGYIDINGGDFIDLGIGGVCFFGMKFNWICFDGGLFVFIYNDIWVIVVLLELFKRILFIC